MAKKPGCDSAKHEKMEKSGMPQMKGQTMVRGMSVMKSSLPKGKKK